MSRRLGFVFTLSCLGLCAAAGLALWPMPRVPDFEAVRTGWTSSDGLLLDRRGRVLDRHRIDLAARRLAWVALDDISPALRNAVIGAEDRRFYRHAGIDWRAAAGAARDRVLRGKQRGASTIAMQLAALIDPGMRAGGRTLAYKIRQMRAARAIGQRWTRAQILEAYFNLLAFRGELVGIDAAARLLFGKAPSGIDREESLVLAALLPAPAAAPERVAARACALDPLTPCEHLAILAAQALGGAYRSAPDEGLAPHLAAALIEHAGTRVGTTLDFDIQRLATDALARHLGRSAAQNMRDGAVLVADVESGAVRAYVAANRATSRAPEVDGAVAPRQAGSTLKPFLYGLALERRFVTAASLIEDSPIDLNTAIGLYIPQNYDRDFKGLVSVRTALASSLNIPAVRTLVLTGVEAFRDRLVETGYRGIDRDGEYYGYSLALGSAEVTLWQQVAAYRALARGGLWSELHLLPGDAAQPSRRIMEAGAAAIVADILSDRAARVPTFGVNNALTTPFWSAAKTGTSKDMRDNWCIGFTTRHAVGVWVGNFEGDSMHDVSGVSGSAAVWHEVIGALHMYAGPPPPTGPGVVAAEVRFEPAIEAPRRELFLEGTAMALSRALPETGAIVEIASPANGMIVALDPDMPPGRQRILFEARGGTEGLDFVLDGRSLGAADRTLLWEPIPGAHRLALMSAAGAVVDRVLFTVR